MNNYSDILFTISFYNIIPIIFQHDNLILDAAIEIQAQHPCGPQMYKSAYWGLTCSIIKDYFLRVVIAARLSSLNLLQRAVKHLRMTRHTHHSSYNKNYPCSYRVSCSPHRRISCQNTLSPAWIDNVENLDGAVLTRRCQLILLKGTPI